MSNTFDLLEAAIHQALDHAYSESPSTTFATRASHERQICKLLIQLKSEIPTTNIHATNNNTDTTDTTEQPTLNL